MLEKLRLCSTTFYLVFFSLISIPALSQDNSPYSRYGLGDQVPSSNITTRGMAGISAAYADFTSVNFNNPASYSNFLAYKEKNSNKLSSGRVIMDVGINFINRTLVAPNTPNRFTSSELHFSYLQLGIPLRRNWGLSFGLRPLTRISYKINREEFLKDPSSGDTISESITQFKGSGGSYLPTIGTGFGFNISEVDNAEFKKTSTLSFGVNGGYLFGSRQSSTLRSLVDTSERFYSSEHTTNSSFGDLFFNSGLQFQYENVNKKDKKSTTVRFGIAGNMKHTINANSDSLRQTFTRGNAGEILQIDSVYQRNGVKGSIVYPSSFRAGFTVQKTASTETGQGWLFGADYITTKWSDYRFFGQQDQVQNNWQINVGAQYYPKGKRNYFSRVIYRFGFSTGSDYVKVQNELPVLGISYGMGLPIGGYNRLNPSEFSMLNLAFEYGKRGNNQNLLKENIFRLSAGFSLTDLWFRKKKYD